LQKAYSVKNGTVAADVKMKGYRLPTEAEREYAAIGGKLSVHYEYAGSNNVDLAGWYGMNSSMTPHPIGTKLPNELGLFDMSGNIYEWCWDWYDRDYYNKSPLK